MTIGRQKSAEEQTFVTTRAATGRFPAGFTSNLRDRQIQPPRRALCYSRLHTTDLNLRDGRRRRPRDLSPSTGPWIRPVKALLCLGASERQSLLQSARPGTAVTGHEETMKALSAALTLLLVAFAYRAASDTDWPINGGVDNIRYSPLDADQPRQRRAAAGRLDLRLARRLQGSEMQSNPIVVDGVLYATTPTLKVVAVNAATGREIWKFDPSGGARARRALPASRRHRAQGSRVRHAIAASSARSTSKTGTADRVVRRRRPRSICARGSASRPRSSASAPARRASSSRTC